MKTLRELTGTEGTPWAVQAYLTQKMTGLQGEWSIGQREKLADFLSSSYLDLPLLQGENKGIEPFVREFCLMGFIEIPEGEGYRDMKSYFKSGIRGSVCARVIWAF